MSFEELREKEIREIKSERLNQILERDSSRSKLFLRIECDARYEIDLFRRFFDDSEFDEKFNFIIADQLSFFDCYLNISDNERLAKIINLIKNHNLNYFAKY